MLRDHSFRKAHISIAVALSVMGLGLAIFGLDPSAVEHQLIVWVPFAVGFVSLFLQYHLEDRKRGR